MRNLSCATLFLLSSGCGMFAPKWEGVWFVEVPVMDPSACVVSADENFDDAELFEPDVATGPWTYVSESASSQGAFFVEVLNGKDGEVFVVVGDEVYPGTADKKLLQVEWTGSTDDLSSQEHEEGYLYSQSVVAEVLEKLTLVNPTAGQATGTMQVTSTSVQEWYETDRWRFNQIGISYSQMPSTSWLTGNRASNLLDSLECADDDCHLRVETSCDGQIDLTASFAGKYENGMFSGIEDAGQDPGAGGPVSTY